MLLDRSFNNAKISQDIINSRRRKTVIPIIIVASSFETACLISDDVFTGVQNLMRLEVDKLKKLIDSWSRSQNESDAATSSVAR